MHARVGCLFFLLLALLLASSRVGAQQVGVHGVMGDMALLSINGGAPKSVRVGQTHQGVRVISIQADQVVLDVQGNRQTLRVGQSPIHVAPSGVDAPGQRVVINASSGGHFITQGQINGKTIRMVVDTGATLMSIGVPDAKRLGLDYASGERVQMVTANGVTLGWRLRLATVKVGDVIQREVDAVVTTVDMPYVLLGNSFLSSFQMSQNNGQMVLEKRY